MNIDTSVQLASVAHEVAANNAEARSKFALAVAYGQNGQEHLACEFALDAIAASKGVESPEFAAGLAFIKAQRTVN